MHTNDLITSLVTAKREAKPLLATLCLPNAVRPDAAQQDAAVLGFLDMPCIKALPTSLQEQVCNDYYATPYLAWAASPRPASAGSTVRFDLASKAAVASHEAHGTPVGWTFQCSYRTGTEPLDAAWKASRASFEHRGYSVRTTFAA